MIKLIVPDELLRYGGHIGYGVRRSYWNKGIGKHYNSKIHGESRL